MKIYLLIHEQDTDDACNHDVRPFTEMQAAADAMRNGWAETAAAWEYAAREHDGEDECKCHEDAAVIRDGGDVEHWRIEEHDLAVPVSIVVEAPGGLVRNVYAKGGDVDVAVLDPDSSDPSDEDGQDEAEGIKEKLDECINAPGWMRVW